MVSTRLVHLAIGAATAGLLAFSTGCAADFVRVGAPTPRIPAPAEIRDPPSRVARLSYLTGSVSFQAAGTDDWSTAVLNRPLTEGDQVWTDVGARVELHLGSAAIRLSAGTSFTFLALNDRSVQAKITAGVVAVRIRRLDSDTAFELDTPNGAITLEKPGDYRLEIHPEDNSTRVIVRAGDADASGPTKAFPITAGQQVIISGTDVETYGISSVPPSDAFDEFCQARDRREDRVEATRYVSPDVIGVHDLDDFGYWHDYQGWGPVWIPRHVPAGWAPYRFGHWVWVAPWGWTWMDDTPWGFAPFHYGRWAFLDSGWCWIPGPIHVRPVYSPALVAFVGGGSRDFHFFFWIGRVGVAWFPLGPREPYIPPYHCSRGYLADINITNTSIEHPAELTTFDVARQKYANRSAPSAVTVAPRDAFVGGQPIGRVALALSERQLATAHVTGSVAPAGPIRQSLAPENPAAARPSETIRSRPVIVRRSPAPAPVPFERQRPLLDARPGRPLDPRALDELRENQPQARSDIRPAGPRYQPRPTPPVIEPRKKEEVQREQKLEQNRTRGIQNERQRRPNKRPAAKEPI